MLSIIQPIAGPSLIGLSSMAVPIAFLSFGYQVALYRTGSAAAPERLPQLRSARSSRCILSRINNGREAPRYGYSLVARLEVASRNSRDNSNRSAKYRNRSGVAAGLIR